MRLRSVILSVAALCLLSVLFPQSAAVAFPGQRLWLTAYTGTGGSYNSPKALAVSPDGSKVFVTGSGAPGPACTPQPCGLTEAYDASSGAPLWLVSGLRTGLIVGAAIAVSPDGSTVFVTGTGLGAGSDDYLTFAYNASNGEQIWSHRYNGPSNVSDAAVAIRVSPDGATVYVTGSSPFSLPQGTATVAYDAATGHQLWVNRYEGPHGAGFAADAMGIAPDGSMVYITGGGQGLNTARYDLVTLAMDAASGRKVWVRRYDDPANLDDGGDGLAVSPDGSTVVVTGYSTITLFETCFLTVAYDATTGVRKWLSRYHDQSEDEGDAVAISPTGTLVFVTGQGELTPLGNDDVTVAYDAATGAPVWTRRYSVDDYGLPWAIGVRPDGSEVFVTGWVGGTESGTTNIGTVAYDAATGQSLWTKRFEGPAGSASGDDIGALGTNPDGSKVFVTGTLVARGVPASWVTLAYSTT
ncbi:MAG TPA: PQQ-binding-like beta-propeller repeat protein [Actinomycetota bacterium]